MGLEFLMWIFFRGVGVLLDVISEEWIKNLIKWVECLIYVLDFYIKSENVCLYCLVGLFVLFYEN